MEGAPQRGMLGEARVGEAQAPGRAANGAKGPGEAGAGLELGGDHASASLARISLAWAASMAIWRASSSAEGNLR